MANRDIDFQANSMKVPHRIEGTDLYYFQIENGVTQNARSRYEQYLEYLKNKGNCNEQPARTHIGKIKDRAWVIYKKEDDNQSYEEFVSDIKNGTIHKVGDMLFSPVNNLMEVDRNGNILLKTINSDLENFTDEYCGDVLISSDGEVLIKGDGSTIIKGCDKNGYYPAEHYLNKTSFETGDVLTYDRTYTFFAPNGQCLSRKGFSLPVDDSVVVYEVPRIYYAENGYSSRKVYPTGYCVSDKNGAKYYPNSAQLLADADNIDEAKKLSIYAQCNMENIEKRKKEVDNLITFFTNKRQANEITDKDFMTIAKSLIDERNDYNVM